LVASSFVDFNSQMQIQVLNRTTGKPIPNAEVIFDSFTTKTDANGKVVYKLNNKNKYSSLLFTCVFEKDTLYQYTPYDNYTDRKNNLKMKRAGQVTLLTDRSIYRPGQNVFFKAIAVYRDEEEKTKVVTDRELKIEVRNANNEK